MARKSEFRYAALIWSMSQMTLHRIIFALIVVALLGSGHAAQACDMCKDAVATNAGGGGIDGTGSSGGLNFNASIFLMLGGVFSVMGWIGWIMYRSVQGGRVRGGFPVEADQAGR